MTISKTNFEDIEGPICIINQKASDYIHQEIPIGSLYTTMRLVHQNQTYLSPFIKGYSVIELPIHLERLKIIRETDRLFSCFVKMINHICELEQCGEGHNQPGDIRVTAIRTTKTSQAEEEEFEGLVFIYEKMPITAQNSTCQVEVKVAKRTNPVHLKSSQWIQDRKGLEESMEADSNEIIMADTSGRLFEGLSSNFFIINSRDQLQTAPLEDVLIGSTLTRILKLWKGGSVEYCHPNINTISTWKGAFIASTSRLILPIHRIILPNQTQNQNQNQKDFFDIPVDNCAIKELQEDLIESLKSQ